MRIYLNPIFLSLLILSSSVSAQKNKNVSVIAFGSCANQRSPQPVLKRVIRSKPDAFIYLGDNIYSDTYKMWVLKLNYKLLGLKPRYRKLKTRTSIFATWDDHDYGWNDAGRHYPYKAQSKNIFLNFFGIADSTVLSHEGIYHSKIFKKCNKKIQLILLDTRTFRDDLLLYQGEYIGNPRFNYELGYSAYQTTDSTILGNQQWQWLAERLNEPADVRIIASSIQFGASYNGMEAWANFPHEQKRMLDLIDKTKANGVIFISGDVHYGEISKINTDGAYPIYDITSSGITSITRNPAPNDQRIAGPVLKRHFGLIRIDWDYDDPKISFEIQDVKGKTRVQHVIRLNELMRYGE